MTQATMKKFETDVLVIGSGAGGLATAVAAAHRGLQVVVAEKEVVFGGTTARSGGWMWLPNNPQARAAGLIDSPEAARQYLRHEAGAFYDAERVDAFLDTVPEAMAFYEAKTELKFDLGPFFADYHPTAPGGMDGGRSLVARPFDARALGDEVKRLRPPLAEITLLGMMIGSGRELLHFFNATRSAVSAAYVGKLLVKYARDMLFHGRPMRLTNGNALVGRLAKSAFDRNVAIWTAAPAVRLIRDEVGTVVGAEVHRADGPVQVIARRGVVLAAGGFPQDPKRRQSLLRHDETGHDHVSPAPPGNTGDGLRMVEDLGIAIDTSLPHPAAWVPISRPRMKGGALGTFPHFVDRSKPGIIAVTRSGRRFVNEAQSYHDFCQAMYDRCLEECAEKGQAKPEFAAWFVTDHRAMRKYGLGFVKPAPVPFGKQIRDGYLLRGRSIAELAEQIGCDPAALETTIREFNKDAVRGEDPAFGKGSTSYNRSLGDPAHKPNPCVAPIAKGPFYAVRLHIGDLGTFAGIRTNADAQVLDDGGMPVGGLYAVGNDALSIMGGNYPGGGITLGPAITFGYIAARHLEKRNGHSDGTDTG
ncbi:MAG: FAD-dependent oxidoreductase [Shinella sp.]|uniref:FAD-dependent oxidoreductase n=1 Tax=Shinella sp. TaxID=1870904 RepID=UPI003C76E961